MSQIHNLRRERAHESATEPTSWVRTHPTVSYFLLTYAISWSYWAVVLGAFNRDSLWWIGPGTFGPAVAAVVVTARVDGRDGLHDFGRRMVLWRLPPRWYVVGVAVLPALVVVSYTLVPDDSQAPAQRGWLALPIYLATALVISVVGGGQEEPGWRGFALPRMQIRWGPLRAALLLGALWGLWHLPLFMFVPNYDNSGHGLSSVALMFVLFVLGYAVGMSIVLAWLFNNTRGSILFAMLTHGCINAAWALGPTQAHAVAFYVTLAVVAVAVIAATRGGLGWHPTTA